MRNSPAILLVHGSWHGSWFWDPVIPFLVEGGRRAETVELPTVHARTKADLGVADDAAHLRSAIEDIDGPVVVVAHSYGGIPANIAASGMNTVKHLVHLAAFVLDVEESLLGAVGGIPPAWLTVDGGLVSAGSPSATAASILYDGLDERIAEASAARLLPQSLKAFTDPVSAAAWHSVPSTYLLTERDRAIPRAAQEAMATRAGGSLLPIATGHSATYTHPDVIAAAVLAAGA